MFIHQCIIHVPLNHSNFIKSFNTVSFQNSLAHSTLYYSNIRKLIQHYIIRNLLRSYNLYHSIYRISDIQFHSLYCISFTIVPYTMYHLVSFNVLSYSTCFIQHYYFKSISIIQFHSTYYRSQASSFNDLIQKCF